MEDADSFKVDYAASDRSTCVKCHQTIDKGALRMAPMVVNPKIGDFKIPSWHHFPKCFEENFMRRFAHKLTDVQQISGIDRIKFEDQQKLKSLVITADSKLAAKATTVEEKQLAQESKTLWNFREKLDGLETRELQDMLMANNQPYEGKIFGGRGKLLDRCADGLMFGAIPKCKVCKNGDLNICHGEYKCTGDIDAFARCEYKCTDDELERSEWKIPSHLKSAYDFLEKFKFKAREKAAAITGTAAVVAVKNNNNEDDAGSKKNNKSNKKSAAAAVDTPSTNKKSSGTRRGRAGDEGDADNDDETGPQNPAQQGDGNSATPLVGIAVTCCGKLSKSQKEIEAEVKKLGGTFVKTAAGATVCIMTQEEADGNGTKKGQECVSNKILCVNEEWLKEIVEQGRIVKSGQNVLANEDKRRPIVRKSGDAAAAVEAKAKSDAAKKSAAAVADGTAPAKSDPIKKFLLKDGSAVHPDSGLQTKGKIYKSATGDIFNVMMNQADVTTGTNSYYILQLIEREDLRGRYSIYRKWGRLGTDIGNDKTSEFTNLQSALTEFQKVYLDKTGNQWQNHKNFKKVAGKFMPVETDLTSDNSGGGDAALGSAGSFDGSYNGPLDRPTQNLVALLFDVKAMTAALKEMEIDTEKMPLGRLSKNTIMEGYRALQDAEKILNDPKFTDVDDAAWRPRIVSVTNRFFNFIPHVVPLGQKLPLLSTAEVIKTKIDLLDSLQQLEVASKLVSSNGSQTDADSAPKIEHPLDASYMKLKTQIRALDKQSEDFKRLETYVQNTHASTHNMYGLKVIDIFSIDREGEGERFQPFEKFDNRQLLWHGSRKTNWIGILSQGLRIAPPEAPVTGYMFSKGVYFSSCSSKSANYCFTSSDNTTGIMALNEVALGNTKDLKRADPYVTVDMKQHHSVLALSRYAPDEKGTYWQNDGLKIPMGKVGNTGINDSALLYPEMIVYNVAQVRMRYLFRIEFVYNRTCGTFH